MPTSADEKSLKAAMDELLKENARLRGDLLTIAHRIIHDLRTPLGGINVTAELLKDLGADGDKIPQSMTDSIFDSTDEIVRLLERVSFVLKATARSSPMEPVNMGGVVFEVRQKLERMSLKKGAVISEPEIWPEVNGVAAWLKVIWWNLLLNALQHSSDGVKVRLDWKRDGEFFRFWIEDNGRGVPPDKLGKLFQSFHTLHEPEAKKGLGLAIVRRLVELQNGNWGYDSSNRGGSLFYFTLPMHQAEGSPLTIPKEMDHQSKMTMAAAGH